MRLNHGLIGVALACLSHGVATAQHDDTQPESWEHEPHGHEPPHHEPRLEVHCRAQNDFGYIASAHGTLELGGRTPFNSVAVSGKLEVDTRFVEASSQPRHIGVQGTIDIYGQYLFADVTWGADDLASVFFSFGANTTSYIGGKDSTQYQTECSTSTVRLPQVADLVATKKLRFENIPEALQRAQLEVLNLGNATITGPVARVRIAGVDVDGTLYNGARTQNALAPGEQGTIEALLPGGTLARCGSYAVILDLDHRLQSGAYDPFANDAAQVETPCLRWGTPITEEVLGGPVDPLLAYQTLDSIVNSQVVARGDGKRCNACHFAGSGMSYSPPAGTITPTQQIGTHAWSGFDGWAYEFLNQPDTLKPAHLKGAFRRWLDDGGQ